MPVSKPLPPLPPAALPPFAAPPLAPYEPTPAPEYAAPEQGSPLNALAGLMLIAQSRPEMFQSAIDQMQQQREAAMRDAQFRYQREADRATFTAQEKERKRGAELQARTAASEERTRQTQEQQTQYAYELKTYEAAIAGLNADIAQRQQNNLDTQHEVFTLSTLQDMRDKAMATVMQRHALSGGARIQPNIDALQKNLSGAELGQYQSIVAAQGQEAANAFAAQALKGKADALREAFGQGAGGLTQSQYIKETEELLRTNPVYARLAQESGIKLEQLFSSANMPTFLQDLPPETQALAMDFSATLLPALKGGRTANRAQRERMGTTLAALSLTEGGAEYAERVTEALTTYWEQRYDVPREMGVQIISELIQDYASDEEINFFITPTAEEQQAQEEAKALEARKKWTREHKAAEKAVPGAIGRGLVGAVKRGLGGGP